MTTVDVSRRSFDPRAVALGTVVVGAVVGGVYASPLPDEVTLVGAAVGGAATGWVSRTYEGEAVDGAVATILGTFLAPVVYGGIIWTRTTGYSTDLQIDIQLTIWLLGVAVALIVGLFTAPVGAVTAHVAAAVRRRTDLVSDTLEV